MTKATHPATILAVEDDPSILQIVALLLEDEGFKVLQASNGEAALAVLETFRPDLIISDVMMPGMDGFDLYEHVRQQPGFAQIPFIFLTAKSRRADVRRGMELGADDYLTKPFEAEELLSAVKVRLERAAETRSVIEEASADLQDKIVRTLTHEFRTPLSLVVGYTELLEATGQQMGTDDFQTILHGLYSGSQRLMGLVEDFLLLSRLSTGSLAREARGEVRTTVDPDQVVGKVVSEFESQAAGKDVQLVVKAGTCSQAVRIAQHHLSEIVHRLVDNALKFSKNHGGKVIVACRQEGEFWLLTVADNGIGIPQEALSWIFEAFRQVDREKMEQQGAGVGLAIVRGLAEAYGGRVTVESVLGKGTVFAVQLPLVPE